MKPPRLILFIVLLVAPCLSQVPERESTVTVKVNSGKFTVSALVTKNSPQVEILARQIKQELPGSTIIEIKTDYGVRPFPEGWDRSFGQALQNVRNWHNGIYVFTDDLEKETRRTKAELLESRYTPLGFTSDRFLVNREMKSTLVVLFATWCTPCRREFEVLNDLQTRFANEGLEIVALDIDDERDADIRNYAANLQLEFKLGKTSNEVQNKIVKFTKFGGIPQVLLFSEGKLTDVMVGASPTTMQVLRVKVEKVFNSTQ